MTLRPRPVIARCAAVLLLAGLAGCAPRRPIAAEAPAVREPQTVRRDPGFVYLVLRLGERRLYMFSSDGRSDTPADVESFPVAVGRKEYQTPTGRFQVTDKIEEPDWIQFDWANPSRAIRRIPPGPDNPLGRRWIGFTSAYGWEIGFHGTPHPELLGQAVSHGCVRMRNEDVVKVYGRVTVGTAVIVEP